MPLTPSQRVTLIREITERLQHESWALVDVTLTQFGIDVPERWDGTFETYLLSMVQRGSDQTLIDLARHVGYQFEPPAPLGVDPPFWRKGMFRLFLSHLATHREFAGNLQTELVRYGISAFVAHNDIEPTLEWQVEIETALATCEALVALLHEGFHASNWTDQEIGFAMGRGVPVSSVRLGATPYGFIARFQAFNGNGKSEKEIASELFEAFRRNKQTQHKMSEVLMTLFEESDSFAEAKRRIGYLEELAVWGASFPSRIRAAVERNSQISGSWGVPSKVTWLAKKWEDGGPHNAL